MLKHITKERKATSNNKDSPATLTMIFLAFITSISIILFRLLVWDTVSETRHSFLLIHPFIILFCLVKHFICWPVEDLSAQQNISISGHKKCLEITQRRDATRPYYRTCHFYLRSEACCRATWKWESCTKRHTHVSNRSLESWIVYMWEESLHLGCLTLAMYLGFIPSVFLQDKITVHPYLQHQILFPKWPCWW